MFDSIHEDLYQYIQFCDNVSSQDGQLPQEVVDALNNDHDNLCVKLAWFICPKLGRGKCSCACKDCVFINNLLNELIAMYREVH